MKGHAPVTEFVTHARVVWVWLRCGCAERSVEWRHRGEGFVDEWLIGLLWCLKGIWLGDVLVG